ncbi:BTB/POZ domain-containing protein 18 isoform X2 [Hyperolius riggenbachi]|uniref:BTB/POZ domain-containing protein 18 isoform X2 n=1 Tax=Hyperolius riggenbachi TaxID=752182 RepID=UPI0035A2C9FA
MATSRHLSYWNPRLWRTMFLQLQEQQQAGLYCDVTLQGDGNGLHVHSCVIAACSAYLAKLLKCPVATVDSGGAAVCSRRIISLRGIPSHYLLPLVRYMYTSELTVAPADAHGVLKVAKKLQIQELDMLKLEGGRLVKPELGRKLNRGCLGDKKRNPHAVNDLQHEQIGQIDVEALDENKPFSLDRIDIKSDCSDIEAIQSSADAMPSNDNLSKCLPENKPSVKIVLKRKRNSTEELIYQNNPNTVSDEQRKSSPGIFISPDKSDGGGKQAKHNTSTTETRKSRKLNTETTLDDSSDTGLCISHGTELDSSTTEKIEKLETNRSPLWVKDNSKHSELSNVKCNISPVFESNTCPDLQATSQVQRGELYDNIPNEEEDGQLVKDLPCLGMCNEKSDVEEYFHVADSTVSCSTASPAVNSCTTSTGSEGVKVELDLMTKAAVDKDVIQVTLSKLEPNVEQLHSTDADEAAKLQMTINELQANEVEKVMYR